MLKSAPFLWRLTAHSLIFSGVLLLLQCVATPKYTEAQQQKDIKQDPSLVVESVLQELRDVLKESAQTQNDSAEGTIEFMNQMRMVADRWFDIENITIFVLGPYAKNLKEKDDTPYFRNVFFRVQIWRLISRLRGSNPDFSQRIIKVKPSKRNLTLVNTLITPKGSDAFPLDWRLVQGENGFKVVDMIVQGSSIMLQLRQEYISWLRNNNGDINGLKERITKTLPKELRDF